MLELNHVLFLVGGTLRYTPLDIWQHLSYPLLLNFIPSFLITFPFLKYCHPYFWTHKVSSDTGHVRQSVLQSVLQSVTKILLLPASC